MFALLLALLGMLAVSAQGAGATDRPAGRIVNGTAIGVQTAPWQVSVFSRDRFGSGYNCGGSIMGPHTILTAAHCVDDVAIGADPFDGGLGVTVGISSIATPSAGDHSQTLKVISVRTHPYWNPGAGVQTTGDLALLTLAGDLDLSGQLSRAIALPPVTTISGPDRPLIGPLVSVTGYGLQNVDLEPDGQLYSLPAEVSDPRFCDVPDNAISLCVRSATGVACSGDSGGALVTPGPVPVQVGVVSNGPADCRAGDPDSYVDLTAPENRLFLAGITLPPKAPRVASDPVVTMPHGLLGATSVTCGGSFTDAPTSVRWTLTDNGDDHLLASSSDEQVMYKVQPQDVGHYASCRGTAANAGGVATTQPVLTPSPMSLAIAPGSGGAQSAGGGGAAGHAVFRLAEATLKVTAKRSVRRGSILKVNAALAGLFNQAETGTLCVKQGSGKPECSALAVKGQPALTTPLRFRISRRAKPGSAQKFTFTATVVGKNPMTGLSVQQTRTAAVKVKVAR